MIPRNSYWNPVFPGSERYNFVQHALDAGYSVFFYDRLGSGLSDQYLLPLPPLSSFSNPSLTTFSPSPLTRVQFAPQVSILATLTRLLQLPSSPYTLNTRIRKVVQVGHSFGAFLSAAVLATTDQSTSAGDGLVLTGFSGRFEWLSLFTSGGQARVAALQRPEKWGSLAHGYLVPVDQYSAAYGGFKSPFFEKRVAEWLYGAQKPFAIGEGLTGVTWPLDFGAIKVPVQVCSRPRSGFGVMMRGGADLKRGIRSCRDGMT